MLATQWWWIAPAAVATGVGASVWSMRMTRRSSERRIAIDAAQHDLKTAQRAVGERRRAVKVARAEHARTVAERGASRASGTDVASARRALKQADHEARAAVADVRARRIALTVARAELPAAAQHDRYPVARLRRTHDAVLARWMQYETDPARQIAYPAMSDGKNPATAAFLTALRRASQARPLIDAAVTVEEYSEYRDAVAALERTFDVAEHTAKALAEGRDPASVAGWQDAAQQMLSRSAEAIDRAAGAAASAMAAWSARQRPRKDASDD